MRKILAMILIVVLLAGCNYPPPQDAGAEETSIAETVAASVGDEEPTNKPAATVTENEGEAIKTTAAPSATAGSSLSTATAKFLHMAAQTAW